MRHLRRALDPALRVRGEVRVDPVFGAVPDAQAATDPAENAIRTLVSTLSPTPDGAARSRGHDGKPLNNLELVENLCGVSTALREARRVHVKAFGTLVPHVFMAAVLARVGQCLLMGPAHAQEHHHLELQGIVGVLERGMKSGDRETRNVIAISFVRDSEVELFFEDLKTWLGPNTLGQIRGK
jgi:hypothetical protein